MKRRNKIIVLAIVFLVIVTSSCVYYLVNFPLPPDLSQDLTDIAETRFWDDYAERNREYLTQRAR